MGKQNKRLFIMGLSLILTFILWTVLVSTVDLKNIGPRDSIVGLSGINGYIRDLIGVNMTLYLITDWLGLVPIAVCLAFAIVGLVQWIKRKSIVKVDYNILALGVFYIAVIIAYVLFEFIVINYRPTLIDGYLESSYPSSTTMLVTCVMPTSIIQTNIYIKKQRLKKSIWHIVVAFTVFMVIGRLISGVHWFSDIIGGLFLSVGLVALYLSTCSKRLMAK
jgi:undecaprenyl-diphosphatase